MSDVKMTSPCVKGEVFVPAGKYLTVKIPALCVDQAEFTSGDYNQLLKNCKPDEQIPPNLTPAELRDPSKPMVNTSFHIASSICRLLGKRLPTSAEWKYIASQNLTKEYATRSGKADRGVHYNATTTRPVCAAKGFGIEYGDDEICDMNGNAAEWISNYDTESDECTDGCASILLCGGHWMMDYLPRLTATSCHNPWPGGAYSSDRNVPVRSAGFRCVREAEVKKEQKNK